MRKLAAGSVEIQLAQAEQHSHSVFFIMAVDARDLVHHVVGFDVVHYFSLRDEYASDGRSTTLPVVGLSPRRSSVSILICPCRSEISRCMASTLAFSAATS